MINPINPSDLRKLEQEINSKKIKTEALSVGIIDLTKTRTILLNELNAIRDEIAINKQSAERAVADNAEVSRQLAEKTNLLKEIEASIILSEEKREQQKINEARMIEREKEAEISLAESKALIKSNKKLEAEYQGLIEGANAKEVKAKEQIKENTLLSKKLKKELDEAEGLQVSLVVEITKARDIKLKEEEAITELKLKQKECDEAKAECARKNFSLDQEKKAVEKQSNDLQAKTLRVVEIARRKGLKIDLLKTEKANEK